MWSAIFIHPAYTGALSLKPGVKHKRIVDAWAGASLGNPVVISSFATDAAINAYFEETVSKLASIPCIGKIPGIEDKLRSEMDDFKTYARLSRDEAETRKRAVEAAAARCISISMLVSKRRDGSISIVYGADNRPVKTSMSVQKFVPQLLKWEEYKKHPQLRRTPKVHPGVIEAYDGVRKNGTNLPYRLGRTEDDDNDQPMGDVDNNQAELVDHTPGFDDFGNISILHWMKAYKLKLPN